MPDICQLILDDHETFRRRFAELDEQRQARSGALGRAWAPLGDLLDLHAAAEEEVFYPCLLARGDDAKAETTDAIADHNAIRDAVRAAGVADVASAKWWHAVEQAREQNSDHMAEEERGALADFRARTAQELRDELGDRFVLFKQQHGGGKLQSRDEDPRRYVADEGP